MSLPLDPTNSVNVEETQVAEISSALVDENPVVETSSSNVVDNPVAEIPTEEIPTEETQTEETPTEETPTEEIPTEETPTEETPTEETPTEETPTEESPEIHFNPLAIQTFESMPNPIVELMKQHTRIALLIGLNYTESNAALQNRIQCVNNAKQILINNYKYTEENIIVLIEPSREQVLSTLNNVIGSSALVTEIIIYYAGYGNGINPDLTKESGIIDNFKKVVVPADFSLIDITQLLLQSFCKTVCIMDTCPYKDEEMSLKWSAEITNHVKVVTFCESDSYNSNKNKLLKGNLGLFSPSGLRF